LAKKKKSESDGAPEESGVLKTAAEAIGSALGTIATKTGIVSPGTTASGRSKPGKLLKKNKQRLPRKVKKQMAKANAAKTARS